jgi:hypothetical protein
MQLLAANADKIFTIEAAKQLKNQNNNYNEKSKFEEARNRNQ